MTVISDREMDDGPGAALGSFEVIGGAPGEQPEPNDIPDLWDEDDDDEPVERRTVRIPVTSVTALSAVVVVVGLLLSIWVISRNRTDEPADLATAAPVTTLAAAPTTVAAGAPTTAVAGAPTTAAPSTVAAGAPTTTPAAPTTVAAPTIEAFCQGAADYSLTSLVILGQRAVADPQGVYVAYETMVRNAPPEVAAAVEQLRPLTTQVRDEIAGGRITSPEALRTWLADKAHWPAEAEWLKASQQILPVVAARCAA